MFHIFITPTFERSIKKIKDQNVMNDYVQALSFLEKDPLNKRKIFNIKKLKNIKPGVWRIKIGDYRIRYDVEENRVIFHLISHRKDIYR